MFDSWCTNPHSPQDLRRNMRHQDTYSSKSLNWNPGSLCLGAHSQRSSVIVTWSPEVSLTVLLIDFKLIYNSSGPASSLIRGFSSYSLYSQSLCMVLQKRDLDWSIVSGMFLSSRIHTQDGRYKRVWPNLVLTLPHCSLLFSTSALLVHSEILCP